MLRVGLTGGIGSGKSAVAHRLLRLGAVVTDADILAREVVAPGSAGLAALVDAFGPRILAPDGSLDRGALGAIVFSDADSLSTLNAITHPLIGSLTAVRAAAAERDGASVWVHDVPLLVENGLADRYDAVIVVEAPAALRLDRLAARGVAAEDARRRMASQASDEQRRRVATHVIDNSGSEADLDSQVRALWTRMVG